MVRSKRKRFCLTNRVESFGSVFFMHLWQHGFRKISSRRKAVLWLHVGHMRSTRPWSSTTVKSWLSRAIIAMSFHWMVCVVGSFVSQILWGVRAPGNCIWFRCAVHIAVNFCFFSGGGRLYISFSCLAASAACFCFTKSSLWCASTCFINKVLKCHLSFSVLCMTYKVSTVGMFRHQGLV